jgi:hypothetical protein
MLTPGTFDAIFEAEEKDPAHQLLQGAFQAELHGPLSALADVGSSPIRGVEEGVGAEDATANADGSSPGVGASGTPLPPLFAAARPIAASPPTRIAVTLPPRQRSPAPAAPAAASPLTSSSASSSSSPVNIVATAAARSGNTPKSAKRLRYENISVAAEQPAPTSFASPPPALLAAGDTQPPEPKRLKPTPASGALPLRAPLAAVPSPAVQPLVPATTSILPSNSSTAAAAPNAPETSTKTRHRKSSRPTRHKQAQLAAAATQEESEQEAVVRDILLRTMNIAP